MNVLMEALCLWVILSAVIGLGLLIFISWAFGLDAPDHPEDD